MKNKGYGYFRYKDKNGNLIVKKPTKRQRKRMLIYYLRRRSGRNMTVKGIAKDFFVSDRTMQKLLLELEQENLIQRIPTYKENGVQIANKIVYTGEKKRLKGNECSIDKVYDEDNPLHIRDFEWTDYWFFADDPFFFFNYEEIFGEDGPSEAINEQIRKKARPKHLNKIKTE